MISMAKMIKDDGCGPGPILMTPGLTKSSPATSSLLGWVLENMEALGGRGEESGQCRGYTA